MDKLIHVAFVVDRGYLDPAAVTIASILANASAPDLLRFHVVHSEDDVFVSEQIARWGIANVRSLRVENPFIEADLGGLRVTVAALLKTVLPEALTELWRVIYMDVDFVLLRDVDELWNFDLAGAPAAGVADLGVYRRKAWNQSKGDNTDRHRLMALGLDGDKPQYVNSGLLLLDLEQLRRMRFTQACEERHRSQQGTRYFVDQDIINGVLAGKVALLDPRWNVLAQSMSRPARRRHHYVPRELSHHLALQKAEQWGIHYTGPEKPWKVAGVWFEEKWWRYAPLSGVDWQRPAPIKRTLRSEFREALLDLRSGVSAWWYNLRQDLNERRRTRANPTE